MKSIIKNLKNIKIIFVVFGITAAIVCGVMIASYSSLLMTTVGTTQSCTDSDGGQNYYEKGHCTDSRGASKYDTCYDGKLYEYYCYNNECATSYTPYTCPSGYECNNGACVESGGGSTCTDSDGAIDYFERGTCTDSSGSKTDTCSADGKKVLEYHCVNNQTCESQPWYTCPSGYKCNNGACVEVQATCQADGQCKLGCPNGDPDCSCSQQGGDLCQANETCSGTSLLHSGSGTCCSVQCTSTQSCTDSDGGQNYYEKGHCTDSRGASKYDTCYDGKLYEYYCYNNECATSYTPYTCPSGYECEDGACVVAQATCQADGQCKLGCPNGDPDCSCNEQGGIICQTDEICPETPLKHKDSGTCCPVACIPQAIYSISGKIISDDSNYSVSGIKVLLSGTSSAEKTVGADGNYSFFNLANGSYTITPSDEYWTFSPISQNITVSSNNVSGINFTATLDLCRQYFEVRDENSTPMAGAEVLGTNVYPEIFPVGGPVCTTDNNGRCSFELPRAEKNHTAEAKKDGYECYNNECKRTFNGCLSQTIVLRLKEISYQSADLNCDGKVNLTDSAILMSFWGKDPSQSNSCQSPDINKDGSVNLTDSAIMMSQWTSTITTY